MQILPVPSFNIINGGSHAGNALAMQVSCLPQCCTVPLPQPAACACFRLLPQLSCAGGKGPLYKEELPLVPIVC